MCVCLHVRFLASLLSLLTHSPLCLSPQEYAGEGLRTLALAYKDLDEDYFDSWRKRHHEASTAMEDRDEKLDAIYEEIEKDLQVMLMMNTNTKVSPSWHKGMGMGKRE